MICVLRSVVISIFLCAGHAYNVTNNFAMNLIRCTIGELLSCNLLWLVVYAVCLVTIVSIAFRLLLMPTL